MQTLATTLCWTLLVLGNLLELLSYKWQQNVSFWWSAFPSSGDKLTETKYTFGSVSGKHEWHSVPVRCPSQESPTRAARHLHRCGRLLGGDVYPPGMWHCSVCAWSCVSFLQADFTLLPCALSSSADKCACTPQGNQTWTYPHIFHWFSMGQEQNDEHWGVLRYSEKLKMSSSSAAGWWSEGSIFTCLMFAQRHPCTTFCCSWSLSSIW